MESISSEKIDISCIKITTGQETSSRARVASLDAANSVLQNWVKSKSSNLPNECEVEIIFEDGLRYHSQYPLRTKDKTVSLGRHVRRQLVAMTKISSTKTKSSAANDANMDHEDERATERAKEMLAHYNI